MSCGIRAEIGVGQFYTVEAGLTIDDALGSRGESASFKILVQPNQSEPDPGEIVSIVWDGVKIFGGRYLDENLPVETGLRRVNIAAANYLTFCQHLPIRGYANNNTLRGHALAGCIESDARSNDRPLNLLDVEVIGGDTDFFQFSFTGPGTLQQFLDQLTSQADATWTIRDGGHTSIGDLTAGAIAVVSIRLNSVSNPAPKTEMRRRIPGQNICTNRDFYIGNVTQQRSGYPASVFRVIGRNGLDRDEPGEFLEARHEPLTQGITQYNGVPSADRLVSVRIIDGEDEMPFLEIIEYDPENLPAAGQAAFRSENGTSLVYLSEDEDIPTTGGKLRMLFGTNYVVAVEEDDVAIAEIAAKERNGSTGRVEDLVIDESITSVAAAQQLALANKAMKARKPLTISFKTRVQGWKSGQTFTYINPNKNITEVVTVQSVRKTPLSALLFEYDITASNILIKKQTGIPRKPNPAATRARLTIIAPPEE